MFTKVFAGIVLCITFFVLLAITTNNKQPKPEVRGSSVVKKDPLLQEAVSMSKSKSKIWWLNSGGKVYIVGKSIKTIQGELPENDPWRIKYYKNNAAETDNGYHPQNIFRLVTQRKYTNPIQSMYFKINRYVLSQDLHRSESNGVLFFHRYQDGNNLYYAGLRVDGYAVIKKKINGIYYTMSYQPVFTNSLYSRYSNPNLLPIATWIGIKTEVFSLHSGKVFIKLYVDKNKSGTWQLVAEAMDDNISIGGSSILTSGYAGIRSDFMDVEYYDYQIVEP